MDTLYRRGAIFRLAVTVLIPLAAGCTAQSQCHVIPKSFCQIFADVESSIPPIERESIRNLGSDGVADLQVSFGMELRNKLDLWRENDVTIYFKSRGVEHPDMMSHILTVAFVEYINGNDVDMDVLTADVKNKLLPKPPPPE